MDAYQNEANKKRHYAKRFQPELMLGIFIITLHILVSWLCFYLLKTPINEWFFDFSQYNQTILDIFPKAEYWSNASPVYREKMIILYGLITPTSWAMFFITVTVMLSQYKKYLGPEAEGLVYKAGSLDKLNIKTAVLGVVIFTYLSIDIAFFSAGGSETILLYEDLSYLGYLRASDKNVYNTTMGFYFYKLFVHTLGPAFFTFFAAWISYILVFYFKRK